MLILWFKKGPKMADFVSKNGADGNSTFIFKYMQNRCPMPSTDQAIPSCSYFRISWILME